MKRALLRSSTFARALKRVLKREPDLTEALQTALERLSEDAFQTQLRTHKLKGKLEGTWACSAGFDLRILFTFVEHEGTEAILLETAGRHDEVY